LKSTGAVAPREKTAARAVAREGESAGLSLLALSDTRSSRVSVTVWNRVAVRRDQQANRGAGRC
jgi:hypothetical protein